MLFSINEFRSSSELSLSKSSLNVPNEMFRYLYFLCFPSNVLSTLLFPDPKGPVIAMFFIFSFPSAHFRASQYLLSSSALSTGAKSLYGAPSSGGVFSLLRSFSPLSWRKRNELRCPRANCQYSFQASFSFNVGLRAVREICAGVRLKDRRDLASSTSKFFVPKA